MSHALTGTNVHNLESMRHPRLQLIVMIGDHAIGFAYLDDPKRVFMEKIISQPIYGWDCKGWPIAEKIP